MISQSNLGRVADLATPCLLLDNDLLGQNLSAMQALAEEAGKALRPHAKTHKCSLLARRQIELGAVGICVAKLSEAEALASAGIDNILITGPVVGLPKLRRLADLAAEVPGLLVTLDHASTASQLNEILAARGVSADVLVDLDVGLRRTGVAPKEADVLAAHVGACPQLRLRGVQAYAGQVQHIRAYSERESASLEALSTAAQAFTRLSRRYDDCSIFSGAGTGTHDIDLAIPELTELQVGSYALMDVQYLAVDSRQAQGFEPFKPALTLLTSVVSVNQDGFVTVDAGLKTLYHDGGQPRVVRSEWPGLTYDWFGDEYGLLRSTEGAPLPPLGARVELIVSHCDPTVNLFDMYHIRQGERVIDQWAIDLRGCSQ